MHCIIVNYCVRVDNVCKWPIYSENLMVTVVLVAGVLCLSVVCRLCTQDADQLYQQLETLVREVVIEMKVKLLKELTVDQKATHRAHQFLSLLLAEYYRLCTASQHAAAILANFVRALHVYYAVASVVLPLTPGPYYGHGKP
jgi:hypothetical protein